MISIATKLRDDPKYIDEIGPILLLTHPTLHKMVTKNPQDFIRRVLGGERAPPPASEITAAEKEVIERVSRGKKKRERLAKNLGLF